MLVVTATVSAQLVTYPAPEEAPHNDDYTVRVRQPGGEWQDLYEYDATVNLLDQQHMSFVYFDADFASPVEVSVVKNSGSFQQARLRPSSYSIAPTVKGNEITFTLTEPRKVSVEFDDDIYHNLFVFANPPDTDIPDAEAENVRYFGPGIHHAGHIPIQSGETVYLAGGAVVYGYFKTDKLNNVTVRGRGILCGAEMNHDDTKPRHDMIGLQNASNVTIEGIILQDTPSWGIVPMYSRDILIKNVKNISYNVNSDGIDPVGCENVLIDDIFFRNSDDIISIKNMEGNNKNITMQNSVLWADKAHVLFVGPEANEDKQLVTEDITFENIDILEHKERGDTWWGAMAIQCQENATFRNIKFIDVRVDDFTLGNLIDIRIGAFWDTETVGSAVENVLFKNITYTGRNKNANRIFGWDDARQVKGVVIENLIINGELILTPEAGNFNINQYADVTFRGPDTRDKTGSVKK